VCTYYSFVISPISHTHKTPVKGIITIDRIKVLVVIFVPSKCVGIRTIPADFRPIVTVARVSLHTRMVIITSCPIPRMKQANVVSELVHLYTHMIGIRTPKRALCAGSVGPSGCTSPTDAVRQDYHVLFEGSDRQADWIENGIRCSRNEIDGRTTRHPDYIVVNFHFQNTISKQHITIQLSTFSAACIRTCRHVLKLALGARIELRRNSFQVTIRAKERIGVKARSTNIAQVT